MTGFVDNNNIGVQQQHVAQKTNNIEQMRWFIESNEGESNIYKCNKVLFDKRV